MFTSPYPDIVGDATTLPHVLEEAVRRHPERAALVDGPSGRGVTYAELARRVDRLTEWLDERGVGRGDNVALWTPNAPPWVAVAWAAMRLGATVTALNPAYSPTEAQALLAQARPVVAFTLPHLAPIARECGVGEVLTTAAADGATSLEEVLAREPRDRVREIAADPSTVALLPFSSGTTGLPKGVELTHANLVAALRQVARLMPLGPEDTTLAVAPFFHILGAVVNLAVPLSAGATVVTVPAFEPASFLDLVERHRVRFLAIPPPLAAFLTDHPLARSRDLSSLRVVAVGGAALAPAVHEALARRLPGAVVGQGWGLTETTACVCIPERAAGGTRPGTVGRLVPSTELRVVDPDTGQERGPGEVGELWVRGPQVMAGYRDRPEETRAVLDDEGWLRTGDLGRVEEDGAVVLVDRLKELIKVDAYQVAPAELEALLVEHPDVADAGVVGRPHPRHGEEPVAYVVGRQDLDGAAVQAWLAERVAPYKQLAQVVVVDQLPRTPSGKLVRRRLSSA
jgi:acyl-CoA synthetase (AMP-forming)/AMP-acid ligase II